MSCCRWPICLMILMITILGGVCRAADEDRDPTRPLEADEVARLIPAKLAQLLVKAQDRIETTSKLDTVLIADMQLGEADALQRRPLALKGKVREPEQRALAARVVMDTLRSDTFWNTMDEEFVVDSSQLTVTQPSPEMGTKNFGLAIGEFFHGEYDKADMYFTHALAEDPGNEAIHYWKVATAIAKQQPERAERRLEILCRRNPQGSKQYASALQRLQGPLRKGLVDLEEQVTLRIREGRTRTRK